MRAVSVVVMEPAREVRRALLRSVVGASVGPLAQRRLNETLGFAVGARGVRPGAVVFDSVALPDRTNRSGFVAGPIVGEHAAHFGSWEPGLVCVKCRRTGMQAMHPAARALAERFTGERLDRIASSNELKPAVRELREAALGWIEHHSERKLATRQLLEEN